LAILLIGPRDLPRVATQIGRFYRKLRSAAEDLKDTVERETEWKDPPRTLEKK
jgi:Sec-independent protein translocase protein TatA